MGQKNIIAIFDCRTEITFQGRFECINRRIITGIFQCSAKCGAEGIGLWKAASLFNIKCNWIFKLFSPNRLQANLRFLLRFGDSSGVTIPVSTNRNTQLFAGCIVSTELVINLRSFFAIACPQNRKIYQPRCFYFFPINYALCIGYVIPFKRFFVSGSDFSIPKYL